MRIISGTFKGRSLLSPPESTRPTADRAKEMLFDMLSSRLMKLGKRWQAHDDLVGMASGSRP